MDAPQKRQDLLPTTLDYDKLAALSDAQVDDFSSSPVLSDFNEKTLYTVARGCRDTIARICAKRPVSDEVLAGLVVHLINVSKLESRFKLKSAKVDVGLIRQLLYAITVSAGREDLVDKAIDTLVSNYNILELKDLSSDRYSYLNHDEIVKVLKGKVRGPKRCADRIILALRRWDDIVDMVHSNMPLVELHRWMYSHIPGVSMTVAAKFLNMVGISNVNNDGIPVIDGTTLNFMKFIHPRAKWDCGKLRKYGGKLNMSDLLRKWCTLHSCPVVLANRIIWLTYSNLSEITVIDLGGKVYDEYGNKESGNT